MKAVFISGGKVTKIDIKQSGEKYEGLIRIEADTKAKRAEASVEVVLNYENGKSETRELHGSLKRSKTTCSGTLRVESEYKILTIKVVSGTVKRGC